MEQQLHSIALLVPELKELLKEKNFALAREVLRECCSPIELADSWRKFDEDQRLQVFKLLSSTAALKLFEILEIEDQKSLLGRLNDENLTPLLEDMPSQDIAQLFHKMSPRQVKKMTSLIKRQEALAHIDLLMKFPEQSAGSLMHPEFIKLSPKLTAKQALSRLQAIARPNQKEHLYALFVTDETGRLLGSVTLQDLVSAPEDEKLFEFMSSTEGIKIKPETDQEEISKIFSKYHLTAAPVTDAEGKLIGVITVGDVISVVKQEATEDIAKMVGTKASDIRETSVFKTIVIRMPWLVVTVMGGLLVSFVIRHYEPTLAKVIALASFSPLIAGMGGNVGAQSATIMVRSLALGHVTVANRAKLVVREIFVGISLGVFYGIFLGLVAHYMYGHQYGWLFSLNVAIGMCTSMTVAATMGSLEPLIFEKAGIDPATATGPLITTTTDIISNFTYLSIATFLFLRS